MVYRLRVFDIVFGFFAASSVAACVPGRPPTNDELTAPGPALPPRDAYEQPVQYKQVAFPHAIAEGHGDGAMAPLAAEHPPPPSSASAAPAPSTAASTGVRPPSSPPDPEPLRSADQWEYEVESKAGKVAVRAVAPRHFASPVVSARRFGRFAIELWVGAELIDRVRFDFPGLALEQPTQPGARRPLYGAADLTRGANVRQKVLIPASPRARQALLVDRATGEAIALPWPPELPTPAAPTPAPTPAPSASAAPTVAPKP